MRTSDQRRIVTDAGPLIALFYLRDRDHENAVEGIRALGQARIRVLVPAPVVFEVYKWLVNRLDAATALRALRQMRRDLDIRYPTGKDLDALIAVLQDMPTWRGSLEDAIVAQLAQRLGIPVWTFNYRDLAAFGNLQFWTPMPR